MRTILHSDCNGFYASVESLLHPEYRDKPLAVAGDAENRHGIILAKNELAKKYFVKTGDAIWQAKNKCPELVVIEPHFDQYMKFSKLTKAVYAEYTDRVESFGLDEAWLDVTGCNRSGYEIAKEINERIKYELGITVSIGVSFNKIFAKLGSDYKKPDAITKILTVMTDTKTRCGLYLVRTYFMLAEQLKSIYTLLVYTQLATLQIVL